MPPAIIGAAIALGASAAAAASIISVTTALVIGMAATAAGALLTKSPKFDFSAFKGQQERKQVLRAAASSRVVVYGTTVSSGLMTFAEEESGEQDEGELLHLVLTLASHPLEGIGEIWLGDDAIEVYRDHVTWEFHNNNQSADPYLLSHCPSWKEDMIGKGLAWLRISFKFDAEKFPSGLPNVKILKKGRRVYDPRSGQEVFSDNAALVILDYFRFYLKRKDDVINWDQFIEAANICDEIITNTDNTSERRYRINGEFEVEEAPSKILDAMLEACGGELTYIGGKHGLLVGAYYGPATMVLDESCIAGDIKIVPETSYKERTNTITGTFIDPEQNYTEADFPPVVVKEWVDKDGGEITQDMAFRFVTSHYQAQRLANIILRRKRIGRTIEIPCNMKGYKFRPGMYIKLNIPQIGIRDVEMRVTKWSFDPKGGVNLTVRQDFLAMWDDAIGKPIERPDLVDLPTGGIAQPQNLQYQVLQISDVVQGVLTWNNIGQFSYNRVSIRQNGTTIWTAQVPGQNVRVTGLLRGAYTAHVQAVAYSGAISPEAYLEFNIQAPPPPSSVEVQNGYFAITLIPRIKDLTSVSTQFDFWTSGEIRLSSHSTEIVETQATRKGMGTTWTDQNLKNDHTYYWYIRTINAFGSSAFVEVAAVVHAETGQLIDFVEATLSQTESYKNLVAAVEEVEDGVTSLEKTVQQNDSKYTQQISSVQSSVGGLSATVQQQASAFADLNGKLSAQWGQKVQVDHNGNKYVSGMQMGVEGQGGQYQSYWMVSADNFAVYNPIAGGASLAFVIKNGQVFMREGFIEDGSISNAKIGNYIQSWNWNGNDQGWYIGKDGGGVFNNVTVRGNIYANNGVFNGTVYATNGRFTGTVEAQSFIGDIANMHTGSNVERLQDGVLEKVIKYTDSSSSGHARHVCVIANVKGNGAGRIDINGNVGSSSVQDLERLIMHSAVVTGPNVTVTITVSAQNNRGAFISSPTVIVSHGSGSFTG